MRRMASTGLALGFPPLLASCGRTDDDAWPAGAGATRGPTESRTMFFNFAHLDHVGRRAVYEAGGLSYELVPVAQKPAVLATARATNGFLRAVPDEKITHHAEAVELPTDSVLLTYVVFDTDRAAGTWTMGGIYLQTASTAIPPAHAVVSARMAQLQQSPVAGAQRDHYGLPAANSANDLIEQSVLLDPPSHAASLIGLHPNLMALEPVALNIVQHGHLKPSSLLVGKLASTIKNLGDAVPGQANPPNETGWATLVPIVDPTTGKQARITEGPDTGRLQYRAQWHPKVAAIAGQAMRFVTDSVKDDESLGADISSGRVADGGRGKLWLRRDGDTNVVHTLGATATVSANAAPTMTLKGQTSQGGITVKATSTNDGRPVADVTIENWYLRYLGAYVQFLDSNDPPNVIALADMPDYGADRILIPGRGTRGGKSPLDSADTMFVGAIPPVSTVLGIPIEAEFALGSLEFTVALPQQASAIRVLAGGLGGGSVRYPQTLAVGASMTSIFNYGFTALFAWAGAAPALDEFAKDVAGKIGDVVAQLAPLVSDLFGEDGNFTVQFWIDQGAQLAETIVGKIVTGALGALVGEAVLYFVAGNALKAAPIVDGIMAAVSAFIGAGEIIQSSVEIALSPWTYVNDLAYSIDLGVKLVPVDGTFPASANHCRVTAMFDDGTPHVLDFGYTPGIALPPIVFRGVPFGGNVNVSVAFRQSAIRAGESDILLGKGSSGLQPNDGTPVTIPVEQVEFPIGPATTYRHRVKTMVDDANRHVWVASPAPTTTASADCGDPGTICGLRSITVRQQTAKDLGYLGYAWQSRNADPSRAPSCTGGGSGQLDQLAVLATGTDPQSGYVLSGCGFDDVGVRVAYSLLSEGGSNFYLDTEDANAPLLRQVALGASPSIGGPASQQAWGALNFASDALLLHPSGQAVSINGAYHKIETVRLPRAAVTDTVAKKSLRAEVKSGKGSRPGLIDTPIAAAITSDGTVLVLEAGNNRIQALNLGANPVPYFKKQPTAYFLSLDAATSPNDGWTHLDIAVEFTGFIYVLSTNATTGAYRMNIYHPAQGGPAPIAIASTMNAAKLTVDFWRNVYTLNYEAIQRRDLGNRSPVPVTEPSVSLWTPCDVGRTCSA